MQEIAKQNDPAQDSPLTDILSYVDGIPLPPAIKKNLWNSIGRLIKGAVDVPVAMLEAKAQQIKAEADALSRVTKAASEAASKQFKQDYGLIDRSVNYFGSKLLKEQINREKVTQLAIEDLKSDPPKEDAKAEVDPDWLEFFSKIAETKSNEEVQLFLSKILAGEIKRPGTFSLKSIQTLALLDQETAQLFQIFCNMSFEIPAAGDLVTCLISEPFGSPGNNGMESLGLGYPNLTILQDAGLIQSDLNARRFIPSTLLMMQFKIADGFYSFVFPEGTQYHIANIAAINFTKVGIELRKVIHKQSNEVYIAKFIEWATARFALKMVTRIQN